VIAPRASRCDAPAVCVLAIRERRQIACSCRSPGAVALLSPETPAAAFSFSANGTAVMLRHGGRGDCMHKARLVALMAVQLAVGAAAAADDVIAQRRELMLQNSHAALVGERMLRPGKFSVEKATAAMKTLQDNMTVFPTLFPVGSDTGNTLASPTIWENMDDFKAIAAKLVVDAKAAELAAADGQEAFRLPFIAVLSDCSACHPRFEKK
jgi:cytochrome c556